MCELEITVCTGTASVDDTLGDLLMVDCGRRSAYHFLANERRFIHL